MPEKLEDKEIVRPANVLIVNFNVDQTPYVSIAGGLFDTPRQNGETYTEYKKRILENASLKVIDLIKHPDDKDKSVTKANLLLPFERLNNYQAVIITGSQLIARPSVIDHENPQTREIKKGVLIKDWRKEFYQFVYAIRDAHIPLLGICFGAEGIVEALGGQLKDLKTQKGSNFWEIGWSYVKRYTGSREDPVLRGLPEEFLVPQDHEMTITKLPEGGEVLLENERGVQGFKLGKIYGFQFHPEKSREQMMNYLDKDDVRQRLEKKNKKIDDIKALGETYNDEAKIILSNFLRFAWQNAQ